MLSSFVVSFSGIWDISQYTGLPVFLQWVPALFIDAAILAYTIALFVFKARGEGTFRTIFWLMMFAGVSVAANVAHTLDYLSETGIGTGDYRLWIGVAITASAPIAVLAASEEISRLAFIKTDKKKK
jgi:FlaA1/EpsC-like NDP-sugar epimerase